jgi:site-specific DNA recombinase
LSRAELRPLAKARPRTTVRGRAEEPQKPRKAQGGRLRVVAYARVSTSQQTEEGVSLQAQAARFRAYAESQDLELVEVVTDSLSGKNLKRPGLQRALAMLDNGEAGGLLITKLDRLTRDLGDGEELVERYFRERFPLFCLAGSIETRSAAGRLMYRVLLLFAQFERELTAERTREGLAFTRSNGGGTPRLEGDVVERIVALIDEEKLSFRQAARQLVEEGIPTLKGGTWAMETVRKVYARAKQTA